MSTDYKSVRLTEAAYEELERRKRPGESFSDTIHRLARERPIADVAGVFSTDDVASIREARSEGHREYARKREEQADE